MDVGFTSGERKLAHEAVKNAVCTAIQDGLRKISQSLQDFCNELRYECIPTAPLLKHSSKPWFHIPYFPSLHRPGWLARYILFLPPLPMHVDWGFLESLESDCRAGFIVALTLIPQVCS